MKYLYKVLILFIFCLLFFNISVKADIIDTSDIFNEAEEEALNLSILDFKDSTGFDICIEVVYSIPEGKDIETFSSERYLEVFPENDGIYYLISSSDGNLIIQYGEFDEIVTKELISVMLLSMNTDFENGEVLNGILSSILNGKALILENQREVKLREDNHEVLEERNNLLDYRLFICIGCGIVFIGNFVYLFLTRKNKIVSDESLDIDNNSSKNLENTDSEG